MRSEECCTLHIHYTYTTCTLHAHYMYKGAGVYQGLSEEELRKERSDALAPAFTHYIARGLRSWWAGDGSTLVETTKL